LRDDLGRQLRTEETRHPASLHFSPRILALGALAAFCALGVTTAHAEEPIRLTVESPVRGVTIESKMHMAEVRGIASAEGGDIQGYDVMVVLDVSRSTETASGADVDGDGEVGENPQLGLYAPGEFPEDMRSTDPDDTILHAEVKAARTILDGFDPKRVRVGLITFSGKSDPATGRRIDRKQKDAFLQVPLTHDYGQIEAALARVLAEGPSGATNFAAGIRLATRELTGLGGGSSAQKNGMKPVILFLTDGQPSFPAGLATVSDPGDIEAAVAAARVAQQAGIRINSYALGPDALTKPLAATEIARVTLGTFTPVVNPGDIGAALQTVSFANVEDIGMLNLTTREDSADIRLNPDGSFQGFVPVREGTNRVLVNALASDGSEANVEISFTFKVKEMDDRDKQKELEATRRMNVELLRALEAERIKQAKRRQRMQQELDIRVERDEGAP
jgi:hypothetical protein